MQQVCYIPCSHQPKTEESLLKSVDFSHKTRSTWPIFSTDSNDKLFQKTQTKPKLSPLTAMQDFQKLLQSVSAASGFVIYSVKSEASNQTSRQFIFVTFRKYYCLQGTIVTEFATRKTKISKNEIFCLNSKFSLNFGRLITNRNIRRTFSPILLVSLTTVVSGSYYSPFKTISFKNMRTQRTGTCGF